MNSEPPIVIAAGDPAGVGPCISVRAAWMARASVPAVIFGDAAQLAREAEAAGCVPSQLREVDERAPFVALGTVGFVDTGRVARAAVDCHAPTPEGGEAQRATLARAAAAVRDKRGRALVTAPTSKEAVVSAGHAFVGQTEFLARLDGRDDDAVTMLFLGPVLRVALVTTHLAIADVPQQITAARIRRSTLHLAEALARLGFPRGSAIAVAGLNPHAGEAGLFGSEELEVVAPALAELADKAPFVDGGFTLRGPLPAEALFRAAQRGELAGAVAMFHDQATIAAKLLDWGASVNTTWGLSFVRTSVDHGVAYDAARTRTADVAGMSAALTMAVRLAQSSE